MPLLPPMPFQSGYRLFSGEDMNSLVAGINASVLWPGNFIYLDPLNGSDANPGSNPAQAVQSLAQGYALLRAGKNDVLVLMGDGATDATVRLTATFTWAKNAAHLIGICAPSMDAQRARISHLTTATVNINPLFAISGSGCIFANFSFFQGIGQASTAEQLLNLSGSRNYFYNVAFGGIGSANAGGQAGSYVVQLSGAENLFEHCSFGLETEARTTSNSTIITSGTNCQRNQFRDCEFEMYATNSGVLAVSVGSGTLNGGTMVFTRCRFRNLMGASGSTQPTVNALVNAAAGGTVYFDTSTTQAAAWNASATNVFASGAASVGTGGIVHSI